MSQSQQTGGYVINLCSLTWENIRKKIEFTIRHHWKSKRPGGMQSLLGGIDLELFIHTLRDTNTEQLALWCKSRGSTFFNQTWIELPKMLKIKWIDESLFTTCKKKEKLDYTQQSRYIFNNINSQYSVQFKQTCQNVYHALPNPSHMS